MKDVAVIFNIQRFSLHDGPGIRTLVFLKGCSLSCKWCSNPEGISTGLQIKYDKSLCTGCGKCLACPNEAVKYDVNMGFVIDRDKCQLCGLCVENCLTKAKTISGESKTVEQVYNIIKRDKVFYKNSGGGVTLSGGEALLQVDFAIQLLKRCQENGINTAIETAGYYSFENLERVAHYCDTIFYDIKGWGKECHMEMTGASNEVILNNLRLLDKLISRMEKKPNLIVRIPLLPNINFTQLEMHSLGQFLNKYLRNLSHVEILPFHNMGEKKHEQLGKDYMFKDASSLKAKDVEDYALILARLGVRQKIIDW